MAPVAQGDADQTLGRPFLPSALQRRPGAQPRERLLDQRPEQGDEAERHDRTDEPVGEEDAEASLRGQQRLPEGLLGLVAEHDRQHQGRERIVHFFKTYPSTPKTSIMTTSKVELWTL